VRRGLAWGVVVLLLGREMDGLCGGWVCDLDWNIFVEGSSYMTVQDVSKIGYTYCIIWK